MAFSREVIPKEDSLIGTEYWGPYSVPGTSRMRVIPDEHKGICEFGYDIGLTGWTFLEIVKRNDGFFLVYWGNKPIPEKVRKITPRELSFLPQTENHLNNIFQRLTSLVEFSTGLSARAESDLTFLAEELDRLIELHNTVDRLTRRTLPRFFIKYQEDGLLFLKERVFDLVEILMLNRAMGAHLKESLKPHD